MYLRKLVKAGPSSHTIALPKSWIHKHGLKKGDLVYVHDFSDKALLLSPDLTQETETTPRERLIEVDGKSIDSLQREITAAYLNNYSLITFTGNSIPEKAKAIRDIIHCFVALEITEQSTKKISAKDYLNLNEISIDKTIKRVDMIIRTMFEDLLISPTPSSENLSLRDEDINRLYFLLVRLLKSSLQDQRIAKKLDLNNANILSSWQVIHDLENLADHLKQASETLEEHARARTIDVKALYTTLNQLYLETVKAHYQKDKSIAEHVMQQRRTFQENANTLLTKSAPPFVILLVEHANVISDHIFNLARQVLDED